jgi:hypothetical protein
MDGSESGISTEPVVHSRLRTENATLKLAKENAQLNTEIQRLTERLRHPATRANLS